MFNINLPKGAVVIIVILVAVLVAFIVAFTMFRGGEVLKVTVPGASVEFAPRKSGPIVSAQDVKQLNPQQLEDRQAELLRKQEELLKRNESLQQQLEKASQSELPASQAQAAPQSAGISPAAQVSSVATKFDLAGRWQASDGSSYTVFQVGNVITMLEFTPLFGITAAIEGTINGDEISLAYESALGTVGGGTVKISPDGRRISGTLHDLTTGVTFPFEISR